MSVQDLSLTDLTSFSALEEVGGSGLTIRANAALRSLAGLENLRAVTGGLEISANPELTSLGPVRNLASFSDLSSFPLEEDGGVAMPLWPILTMHVHDNPKVPACEAEALAKRLRSACNCAGNDAAGSCN